MSRKQGKRGPVVRPYPTEWPLNDYDRARVLAAYIPRVTSNITKLAKRAGISYHDTEDLVQEGLIVLLNTINLYDKKVHAKQLSVQLGVRVIETVRRHKSWCIDGYRGRGRIVLLPNEHLDKQLSYKQLSGFTQNQLFRDLGLFVVEDCVPQLRKRLRKIIVKRFGLGPKGVPQSLSKVSKELGVSKERVRQLQVIGLHTLSYMVEQGTATAKQPSKSNKPKKKRRRKLKYYRVRSARVTNLVDIDKVLVHDPKATMVRCTDVLAANATLKVYQVLGAKLDKLDIPTFNLTGELERYIELWFVLPDKFDKSLANLQVDLLIRDLQKVNKANVGA